MIKDFNFVAEDKRIRKDILPVKVVSSGGKVIRPDSLLKSKDLQTTTNTKFPFTVMKNSVEGTNAFIVLDFGCEFHGSLRIITAMVDAELPKVNMRITLGESLTEAMSEIYTKGSGNDHSPRDFVREVVMLSDLEYGLGGFRFAKIELLSNNASIQIQSVSGVFIYTDLDYKGSFRCDDEKLNRIYDVAAYTVHLNIQRYIWDGIKRDRLVWIGDINPEVKAIRTVFGQCDEVEKTLDYFRKNTLPDGWMNGMPTYTLWWLITIYEWYLYSGNRSFINRQKNFVLKTIDRILSYIDDDGSIERFPGMFLDWPTSRLPESIHGVKGLICNAVESAIELSGLYNEPDLENKCREMVLLLRKNAGNSNDVKTIAAFMFNAGIKDQRDAGEILTKGNSKGLSTFMSYYILKAISNSGHHNQALDILKEYYGAMLDLGATTFWEDFDIEWAADAVAIDEMPQEGRKNIHSDFGGYCYKGLRHSLCHGWSAGPVPFLNDFVLGIKVIEAGCKTIELDGRLGNLKWAEGTFPTPYGILSVRNEKTFDNKMKTTVKAPRKINIVSKYKDTEIEYF